MKIRNNNREGRTSLYAFAVVAAGILVAVGAAMLFFSMQPEEQKDARPAENRQPKQDDVQSTEQSQAKQAAHDEQKEADETDNEQEEADETNGEQEEADETNDEQEAADETNDKAPDVSRDERATPDPERDERETHPFEKAISEIRQLEKDARFFEAQKRLAKLDERTEHDRAQKRRIAEMRSRLNRWRARVGRALPHLPKLGSERRVVRRAAAERILAAGDVAFVLLRKEVRTATGRRLQTALDILITQRDWRALSSVLQRLLSSPENERAPMLIEAAEMLLTDVPEDEYGSFLEPFREIAQRLLTDESFSRRRVVGLLPVMLEEWFDGEEAAMNRFLEMPEASILLGAYVRAASRSEDQTIAKWGRANLLTQGIDMPSLVGWWRFNLADSGLVTDWSGNGHDGTRNGGVPAPGKIDGALRLNGEKEFVRIPDARAFSGGEGARITGSVLFQVEDTDGFKPLVEKQWGGQTGDWGLYVSGSQLGYYSEATGNDYHLTGGTVQPNTWHHAAFVLEHKDSAANVSLYLDGKSVATENIDKAISADTDGDVFIGARYYNNKDSKGYAQVIIDDVRLFDRAFNGEEIGKLRQGLGAYLQAGDPSPEAADNLTKDLLSVQADNAIRILADALSTIYQSVDEENREQYRDSLETMNRTLADAEFATLADHRKLEPLISILISWFDGDPERCQAWLKSDGVCARIKPLLQTASQSENDQLKSWAERHADRL